MRRTFNVNGSCDPQLHYMVDLQSVWLRLKKWLTQVSIFTINRARQYGKTTILTALGEVLKKDYEVISLDFQTLSYADFENESKFIGALADIILLACSEIPVEIESRLEHFTKKSDENVTLSGLFICLLKWCKISEKKLVFIG